MRPRTSWLVRLSSAARTFITGSLTAFSERKRAEQSRRVAEAERDALLARLQFVFNRMPLGCMILDPEGRVTYWNTAAETIFGYTTEEVQGKTVFGLIIPEAKRADAAEVRRRRLETGTAPSVTFEHVTKDGRSITCEWQYTPLYDVDGSFTGTLGICRDITERLRGEEAERALRAEREELVERLQLLFDRMPVGCIVTDKDILYTYWNPAAERIFGHRFEDVRGKHPFDVVTLPSTRPEIEGLLRRLQAGIMSTNRISKNRTADGRVITCEWQDTPLFDAAGQFIGLMSMFRDVTERHSAEEERAAFIEREQTARAEAEAAAERLRSVQSVMDVVLAPLDTDELLRELLPRVRAIFNADTASVLTAIENERRLVVRAAVGLDEEFVRQVSPSFGRGFVGRIAAERRAMVVDDVVTGAVDSPMMRAAGFRSLAGAPLLVEGRLLGVLHIGSRTVSAFAENDLLLLQLLADRMALMLENARLQRQAAAAAAAMEADRLKTDLLNTVSHELRTPLAAIKGFTTTIQSFYAQISEEELRDFLGEIDSASDRLQELIENLLQLSRMESGAFRLNSEPTALSGLLRQAVDEAHRRYQGREILLEIEEDLPLIRADGRRLGQVLANLIENAVKYSPDGGEIAVRAGENGAGIWFSVADHGLGIAPQHLQSIFDRFYRVDTPRTREIGGTGLGLAICARIVEEHGGRIEAKSVEGEGSTFIVTLPRA